MRCPQGSVPSVVGSRPATSTAGRQAPPLLPMSAASAGTKRPAPSFGSDGLAVDLSRSSLDGSTMLPLPLPPQYRPPGSTLDQPFVLQKTVSAGPLGRNNTHLSCVCRTPSQAGVFHWFPYKWCILREASASLLRLTAPPPSPQTLDGRTVPCVNGTPHDSSVLYVSVHDLVKHVFTKVPERSFQQMLGALNIFVFKATP